MKYLLLMRHAKSSWKDTSLPDHQRPLNKRGRRDAPRMGAHLQGQGLEVDAILCSTAQRARATVEGLLEEYSFEGQVQYLEDLYGAGPGEMLALLVSLPDAYETVMLVSHNPGLDLLLERLSGQSEHMPTASMAYLRFPIERWGDLESEASAELLAFWKPREL